MTRKDYELIAQTLKELREELENNKDNGAEYLTDVETVAIRLASSLQTDNPRFQVSKFLKAVTA